jgi:putative N-acetyltransferase (TIGR04045 family)
LSPVVVVRQARSDWELAGCRALRRQVFCVEQRIFESSDRDAVDDVAISLAAVSTLSGMDDAVVGTVRLHQSRPGEWVGSRLAVARGHRQSGGIGSSLIMLAVYFAHARGATRFIAHVQSRNAPLFHALHWWTLEETLLHGHPHHLMQADLSYYPASGARALQVFRTVS